MGFATTLAAHANTAAPVIFLPPPRRTVNRTCTVASSIARAQPATRSNSNKADRRANSSLGSRRSGPCPRSNAVSDWHRSASYGCGGPGLRSPSCGRGWRPTVPRGLVDQFNTAGDLTDSQLAASVSGRTRVQPWAKPLRRSSDARLPTRDRRSAWLLQSTAA